MLAGSPLTPVPSESSRGKLGEVEASPWKEESQDEADEEEEATPRERQDRKQLTSPESSPGARTNRTTSSPRGRSSDTQERLRRYLQELYRKPGYQSGEQKFPQ